MKPYDVDLHRREHRFIRSLIPVPHESAFDHEPEDEYLARVRPLLPSFSDEVLVQWFLRHEMHAHEYDCLGYRGLRFEREHWTTERYVAEVHTYREAGTLDGHCRDLLTDEEIRASWLGGNMVDCGTWPVAPIVLLNEHGLLAPNGLLLATPYHLLQGHTRTGYLRALHRSEEWTARPTHDVWIARADPGEVLAFTQRMPWTIMFVVNERRRPSDSRSSSTRWFVGPRGHFMRNVPLALCT